MQNGSILTWKVKTDKGFLYDLTKTKYVGYNLDTFKYERTFSVQPDGSLVHISDVNPSWYLFISPSFTSTTKTNTTQNTTSTKVANTTKDAVIRANDSTIKVGDSFKFMKNVSAKDNGGSGVDLTNKVKVSGSINTKIPKTYNITYRVTGANGNTVTKKVTVTVVADKPNTTNTTKTTNTTTKTPTKFTEKELYNSMIALKTKYPDGTSWTNDNSYAWKGGIYSKGYGCAGFAMMLSDAAFGDLPARKITDFSNIRVGDILRLDNDTHSVIVLSIDGSNITIAEGNFNSSVKWGRVITLDSVLKTGTYIMTRYPS